MNFALSDEQNLLKQSLASYFDDRYNMQLRREVVASARGWNPESWQKFAAETGALGASLPEDMGGIGGGAVENMVIMDAMGEHLILEPYLQSIVIGARLISLSDHEGRFELARKIISGDVIVALAHAERQARSCVSDIRTRAQQKNGKTVLNGRKVVVYCAPWATHLIVVARTSGGLRDEPGLSLFLVDRSRSGVHENAYRTIDGFRAADIEFVDVQVSLADLLGPLNGGFTLLAQVLDEADGAVCAEAVGCMRSMLTQTVAYARQRKQFGVPLASFQVLQHRMVDMHVMLEHSTSFAHAAALAAARAPSERRWLVSAAKAYIGKACNFIGRGAVQIHGALGMMDEAPIAQYFKRITAIQGQYGSTSDHASRFASQAGITLSW